MTIDVQLESGRLCNRNRPLVMGILNVTPDSFSDGGELTSIEAVVARAQRLIDDGADVLDLGGESTRPGADPVPPDIEQNRVVPAIAAVRARFPKVAISVDTRRAATARAAVDAGADIVNDISGFADGDMPQLVADLDVPVVLMHMQGTPATMQRAPRYDDVVGTVRSELARLSQKAQAADIPPAKVWLDPGLGFGKRTGQGIEDNCTLLGGLPNFHELGHPLVVGASRKRFIGNLSGRPVGDREAGSLAAAVAAAWAGAAMLRVHEPRATVDALKVAAAMDPSAWQTHWNARHGNQPATS